MKGYVLTIETPLGMRRESISRELTGVSFPWEFVEGIRKDDPSLASLYSPFRNLLYSKRSIAPAEIACYASHRAIWRRIVEGSEPYAIVFEDDAMITDRPRFERALIDITRSDFDFVKFADLRPKRVVKQSAVGETKLVSHKMLSSGTLCYLISQKACRKLLQRSTVFRAVDEDISHAWEFGINVWSVSPNPLAEASIAIASSSIDQDRNSSSKNIIRSLYGELLQAKKRFHTLNYQRTLVVPAMLSK